MDNLLVYIDDYKELNEEEPIAYTRDICTCIVALIHRKKSSTLIHIEAGDNYIELENLSTLILNSKENPILSAELFLGPKTSLGNLSIVTFILERYNIKYTIHDAFRSLSNEYSIGYNFNTKDYYLVTMDQGNPILKKRKIK